jgi:hypothetical protein
VLHTIVTKETALFAPTSLCRRFDFQAEFERLIGIGLEQWLSVVFAIYTYYLRGGNVFEPHLESSFIDPTVFAEQSKLSAAELNTVLRTISCPLAKLREEIAREVPTDPRFDFLPFRSHPLLPIAENRLDCIDLTFVLETLHVGVHWVCTMLTPTAGQKGTICLRHGKFSLRSTCIGYSLAWEGTHCADRQRADERLCLR